MKIFYTYNYFILLLFLFSNSALCGKQSDAKFFLDPAHEERTNRVDYNFAKRLLLHAEELTQEGDMAEAKTFYSKAVGAFKVMNLQKEAGFLLVRMGLGERKHNRDDLAVKHLKDAYEVFSLAEDYRNAATTALFIADIYNRKPEFLAEAFQYYDNAIKNLSTLNASCKNPPCETLGEFLQYSAMVSMADFLSKQSQAGQALDYYYTALKYFESVNDHISAAEIQNRIGVLLAEWGDAQKAYRYFDSALDHLANVVTDQKAKTPAYYILAKKFEQYDLDTLINSIKANNIAYKANVQSLTEPTQVADISELVQRFESKIANSNQLPVILSNQGMLFAMQGDFTKAIDSLKRSYKLLDQQNNSEKNRSIVLNNLGSVYAQMGEYQMSINYLKQGISLDEQYGFKAPLAKKYSNLGQTYMVLGDYSRAISSLQKSIDIVEKYRLQASGDMRRAYLSSQLPVYHHMALAFAMNGNAIEAITILDQSRSKYLLERIQKDDAESHDSLNLVDYKKKLAKDEAYIILTIPSNSHILLSLVSAEHIDTKVINIGDSLREIWPKMKQSAQDGFKKNNIEYREPPNTVAILNTLIKYYLLVVGTPKVDRSLSDRRALKNLSTYFYDLLIAPTYPRLKSKQKLNFITGNILSYLPFSTLLLPDDRYLIESHDIQHIYSLGVTQAMANRKYSNKRKSMLAFGGAKYSQESEISNPFIGIKSVQDARRARLNASIRWSNLPGTVFEVGNITRMRTDALALLGQMASELNLKKLSNQGKLKNYKILHFALHGYFVPEAPEESALVMSLPAKNSSEDGYLTTDEIGNLNLEADFVNLSACDTGLGQLVKGEGVVGIGQSFIIAGANSIAVTLWPVDDTGTSLFMTEFYKRFLDSSKLTRTEAMSQTKREFIKGMHGSLLKDPFYWGAFLIYHGSSAR